MKKIIVTSLMLAILCWTATNWSAEKRPTVKDVMALIQQEPIDPKKAENAIHQLFPEQIQEAFEATLDTIERTEAECCRSSSSNILFDEDYAYARTFGERVEELKKIALLLKPEADLDELLYERFMQKVREGRC